MKTPEYSFPKGVEPMKQDLTSIQALQPRPMDAIAQSGARIVDYQKQGKKPGEDFFNLGIGIVSTPFEVVLEARKLLAEKMATMGASRYINPNDTNPFLEGLKGMVYANQPELHQGRMAQLDAHGGTNADFMAYMFWRKHFGKDVQFIGEKDAWPNYPNIAAQLNPDGDKGMYASYYPADTSLNPSLQNLVDVLQQSVDEGRKPVLEVQPGPQNGLGLVRGPDFWDEYLDIAEFYGAGVNFDSPYAGLSATQQDLDQNGIVPAMEKDWYAIRKAAEMGMLFTHAESLSKTMSFYSARIAALFINIPKEQGIDVKAVQDDLNFIGRAVNSFTSETHMMAAMILNDPAMKAKWLEEYQSKVVQKAIDGKNALMQIAPANIVEILKNTGGMFATLLHRNPMGLETDTPRVVTVHTKSPTLSGQGNEPQSAVRVNTAAIGGIKDLEMQKVVVEKLMKGVV